MVTLPIDALNDNYSSTPLTSGDITPSSVISNDTFNGAPAVIGTNPGQVTLTGVTVPSQLTLNADGTITVKPNTPSGTYTVTYEICENGASPANCDQAAATVVVSNVIDAVNDTPSAVTSGDTTPSVITNDTLDGAPAVIGTNPGQVTLTGVTVPSVLTLNANGTITVKPNTPSGTYTVTYEICENGASPANCDQATATVVVSNVIDAVNDTPSAVTSGDTTPSVITNDTLDGAPAVIGTNPGQVTLTGVTVPSVLTLNANGTITVKPNTPSGTYTVTYEICENGASPANCDQATATVVVSNVIDAVNDTPSAVTSGDITPSVIGNDLLDGAPAVIGTNPGQVSLTGVTVPSVLTLNANGTITVKPNTPSGTYTVTYEICENGASPANCDQATATVVVSNVIDAVNDDFTGTQIPAGQTSPSVIANDLLDAAPAVIGTNPGQVTLTGVTVPSVLTLNADGTITVKPNTPSGTYTVTYEICENGASPANCEQATATVLVKNNDPVANPDTNTTPEDTAVSGNLLTNDTDIDTNDHLSVADFKINGTTYAAGTTATITGVGTLEVKTDGTYTFTPAANYNGTVPQVTYTLTDGQATATSTLDITVTPVNDTPIANPETVSTLEDTPLSGNVLTNDSDIDGDALTIKGFSIDGHNYTPGTTVNIPDVGLFVLNTNGNYTFTPAPNYNGAVPAVAYTITDGKADANTTLQISIIPVDDLPEAVNDVITSMGQNTVLNGTVVGNDLASGDGGNVYTIISETNHGTIVMNADGTYTYTPDHNYVGLDMFTYTICDVDGDCSTATVTITVDGLFIPDGFSPNSDSFNDNYVIMHSTFLKIGLFVYNRWGNLVYQNKDYNDEWRGTGVEERDLPDGTYYSVVIVTNTLTNKVEKIPGYITIKR